MASVLALEQRCRDRIEECRQSGLSVSYILDDKPISHLLA